MHNIFIKWRPTVTGHQNRFDEGTDFVNVFAKGNRGFKPLFISNVRYDDCYVNIAPRVGIALGI